MKRTVVKKNTVNRPSVVQRTTCWRRPIVVSGICLTIGLAISMAIGLPGTAQADKGDKNVVAISQRLQRGGKLLADKDFLEAEKEFLVALEMDPDNLNALRNLGVLLTFKQDYLQAADYLQRAIKTKTADAPTYYDLAVVYGKMNDTTKSLANYREAIVRDSANTEYRRNFGASLLNALRYSEAVEVLSESISLDPTDGEAYYYLGNSYAGLANAPEAIKSFQKSLEFGFDHAELRYHLGMILENIGDVWGAEEHLGIASGMAPGNLEIRQHLGVFFVRTSVYDQAVRMFKENLSRDSNFVSSRIGLGAAYAYQGHLDSALAELKRVRKSNPEKGQTMSEMIKTASDYRKQLDSASATK